MRTKRETSDEFKCRNVNEDSGYTAEYWKYLKKYTPIYLGTRDRSNIVLLSEKVILIWK